MEADKMNRVLKFLEDTLELWLMFIFATSLGFLGLDIMKLIYSAVPYYMLEHPGNPFKDPFYLEWIVHQPVTLCTISIILDIFFLVVSHRLINSKPNRTSQ